MCILNDAQLKQPFILKEALVQSYLQIPVTQIQEKKSRNATEKWFNRVRKKCHRDLDEFSASVVLAMPADILFLVYNMNALYRVEISGPLEWTGMLLKPRGDDLCLEKNKKQNKKQETLSSSKHVVEKKQQKKTTLVKKEHSCSTTIFWYTVSYKWCVNTGKYSPHDATASCDSWRRVGWNHAAISLL